jgi:hypothetical protein
MCIGRMWCHNCVRRCASIVACMCCCLPCVKSRYEEEEERGGWGKTNKVRAGVCRCLPCVKRSVDAGGVLGDGDDGESKALHDDTAAIAIQKRVRGMQARQLTATIAQEQEETSAAIAIQKRVRGMQVLYMI